MKAVQEKGKGHPSHPVYQLVSLKNGDKHQVSVAAFSHDDSNPFSGVVERLNYALHGEVNGGILDTGDFLHLKPQGATALNISVGMKVQGIGSIKPAIGGHRVIEAEEVNGIKLDKKPKPKKKARQ